MMERDSSGAEAMEARTGDSQIMRRVTVALLSKSSLGLLVGASGDVANSNAMRSTADRGGHDVSLAKSALPTFYIDAEYGAGARVFAIGERAPLPMLPPPSRMRKSPGCTEDPREKESRRATMDETPLHEPIAFTLITGAGAQVVHATHRLLVNRAQRWFYAYRLDVPAMLHRRLYDHNAIAIRGESTDVEFNWTPILHAAADLQTQEWAHLHAADLRRFDEARQTEAIAAYAYRFRNSGLLGAIVPREQAQGTAALSLELQVMRGSKCVARIPDAFAHGELSVGGRQYLLFEMGSELVAYEVLRERKKA